MGQASKTPHIVIPPERVTPSPDDNRSFQTAPVEVEKTPIAKRKPQKE